MALRFRSLLFFLVLPCLICAQSPRFERLSPQLPVAGLPVSTILQDKTGFLWFGTWSGLYRYDGYNTVEYEVLGAWNRRLTRANKIACLYEDRQGLIWIGTHTAGLFCFDPVTEKFKVYKLDEGNAGSLSDNTVQAIAEDAFGRIWVGTNDGLNCMDRKTGQFQRFYQKKGGLPSSQIRTILSARDGSLWIGTYRGLARTHPFQDGKVQFHTYSLTPADYAPGNHAAESPHDFIYCIHEDRHTDGALWIGTKAGLKFFDGANPGNNLRHISAQNSGLSNNFVEKIVETQEGPHQILWIGTYNGLNRFNVATGNFNVFLPVKNNSTGINDNVVLSLACDRTGLLWVGTNKGVNKVNPAPLPFHTIRFGTSNEDNLWAITGAPSGQNLWAGSAGGGLKKIRLTGNQPLVEALSLSALTGTPSADFIFDLHQDTDGRLWIATRGAGIIRYPAEGKGALRHYGPADGLSDEHVMCIHEDALHRLWFGGWDGGLMRLEQSSDNITVFKDLPGNTTNLTDYPIVEIFSKPMSGGKTTLWVGTRGGGLFQLSVNPDGRIDSGAAHFSQNATSAFQISNDNITCICSDPEGNIWVCTEDGLNRWDPHLRKFQIYLPEDGLPHRNVHTICFDEWDVPWISTNRGLSRLEFDSVFQLKSARSFDTSDGLPSNIFHDGASWQLPGGHLAFGSSEGLCYFLPSQIKSATRPPVIAFTGLNLFNKMVPVGPMPEHPDRIILLKNINQTEEISLRYADNAFSIGFTALDFLEPQNNRYAYRLRGFHEDWTYVDADKREAYFTNLSEGVYTLEIKATNHDGVWGDTVKSIKIKVLPPLWRTPLAYMLYLIGFSGTIWWYRRLVQSKMELKNQVKIETLKREKTEEIDRIKVRFFTHISHELKTPLTLILSPLEDLLKGRHSDTDKPDLYKMMHRNANKLLNLINEILTLRKTEEGLMKLSVRKEDFSDFLKDICLAFSEVARTRQIDFRLNPPPEKINLWYDREQMEKVFYNLLSNAFKFTENEGRITVHLHQTEDGRTVQIIVEDNGKGIAANELSQVFDLFFTGIADAELEKPTGTGIGLALSKSIVELHGGSIEAHSEGVGKGARFIVTLPTGHQHFDAAHLAAEEDKAAGSPSANPMQELSKEQSTTKEKPMVLIVDDNEDIRAYLRGCLHSDYQIVEAPNGAQAWQLTTEIIPDLIISDILMPEMDGLEYCRQIKTEPVTSHIPVILLTAKTNTFSQINGLDAGADAYLTKPFQTELLIATARNLLTTRERLQKHFNNGTGISLKDLEINHLDEQFLSKCMTLIENNLSDPDYSVEQLGKAMLMSRMQLYRKMKALTGDTPNHFIRRLRLQRAAQLLEKGYSVAEVTYQVGFQDLKYFRENFRKQYGVNPSEYVPVNLNGKEGKPPVKN